MLSSDPHAFLRPIYRSLAGDRTFALLSTERQFDLLVEAVKQQSATHAARMAEYSHPAKLAIVRHLSKMESQKPTPEQVEMWTLHKGERVLSCACRYLQVGLDVRLIENGAMRRTQLFKEGPSAEQAAADWRDAARSLGWREHDEAS